MERMRWSGGTAEAVGVGRALAMAMGMCVPRASQWGVVGHGVSKKGCGGWVMRSSGGAADVGEAVEHDHLEHPHIVAPPHLLSLICLPARRIDRAGSGRTR